MVLGAKRLLRSQRRAQRAPPIGAQDNILPHNSLAAKFCLWSVESVYATTQSTWDSYHLLSSIDALGESRRLSTRRLPAMAQLLPAAS